MFQSSTFDVSATAPAGVIATLAQLIRDYPGDSPVLLDRFLNDAIEVDVDAIADGNDVVIAGVMEHIEEAGIHSGDSTAVIPPYIIGHREQDRSPTHREHQETSTMTLVALTVATASIPAFRLSSSAASRVMRETTRCGPAWISTVAETLSFVTLVITPGNALRRLVWAGAVWVARRSARSRATSSAGTSRWPPVVRDVRTLPSRSQRRSVSTRTPRSLAASPIR